MKPGALLALALVSACAAPNEGRYIGTVTPDQPSPACQPSKATLQVRNKAVLFAPDEGTWLLDGTIAPDGAITAEKTRPAANKQPYTTTLTARAADDRVVGTYKTPRCTAAVALTRR